EHMARLRHCAGRPPGSRAQLVSRRPDRRRSLSRRPERLRTMSVVITRDKRFHLLPGETLLEGLERTGHDVEYQCRSGYCGMCRLELMEGDVSYATPPLAFIGPNEVLPCCCQPNDSVTVQCHLRSDPDSQYELFDTDLFSQESDANPSGGQAPHSRDT